MKPKHSLSFLIILLPAIFFSPGCSKNDSRTGLPLINNANDKAVGSSGRDLLSSVNFATLKIEIQYMTGFAPDAASLNNLTSFLNSLINKPGGITISQKEIPGGNKSSYTINDIAGTEQKNRTAFNSGSQLSVYILITDGAYSDPSVIGVAYRNTSLCILGKTIFDNSGGFGQASRTKLESTVAEHEIGHLLGLVDTGTPMVTNHKDTAHGNHCNVQNCLMYHATETTDFFGSLISGNVPALDANCLADLHANGGK
ncbi:MAG: M12 family metallo-peptidase [Bacteroidia bacterium]